MSVVDLLRQSYVAGVDVGISAQGRVRLTGTPPPTELLAALQEHKHAVATLLQEHRVGEVDELLNGNERRFVTPPDCLAPNACACLGPCARFLMTRPCNYTDERGE